MEAQAEYHQCELGGQIPAIGRVSYEPANTVHIWAGSQSWGYGSGYLPPVRQYLLLLDIVG